MRAMRRLRGEDQQYPWDPSYRFRSAAAIPKRPKAEIRERPRYDHFEKAWGEMISGEDATTLPRGQEGAWTREEFKEVMVSLRFKDPDTANTWCWVELKHT